MLYPGRFPIHTIVWLGATILWIVLTIVDPGTVARAVGRYVDWRLLNLPVVVASVLCIASILLRLKRWRAGPLMIVAIYYLFIGMINLLSSSGELADSVFLFTFGTTFFFVSVQFAGGWWD